MEGEERDPSAWTGPRPDLADPPTGGSLYERCPSRNPHRAGEDPPLTARDDGENDWRTACFVSGDGEDIEATYKRTLRNQDLWKRL